MHVIYLFIYLLICYVPLYRCNFATEGPKMSVDDQVEKVVKEFVAAKKPMG